MADFQISDFTAENSCYFDKNIRKFWRILKIWMLGGCPFRSDDLGSIGGRIERIQEFKSIGKRREHHKAREEASRSHMLMCGAPCCRTDEHA